jgi:hypothetical protein
MDTNSAHVLFDLLGLQAGEFGRAVDQANEAATTTERISWLSVAVEAAFGCIELAGRLRDINPAKADDLASQWRDSAIDLVVRRHEVVENRRAELGGV